MGPRGRQGRWQVPEDWTLGFGLNVKIGKNATVDNHQPFLSYTVFPRK